MITEHAILCLSERRATNVSNLWKGMKRLAQATRSRLALSERSIEK
jgi:uncharacterized protein YjiS (DUF1127 family)